MTTLRPATLSEVCRVVNKPPEGGPRGCRALSGWAKAREGGKNLDSTTEGASGVWDVGRSECC